MQHTLSKCWNLKGVPEKNCNMISKAGVKIKKFKLQKKILKDILNNLQSNYKAQATATFSISALISEIWAFKAKICWYLWNKNTIIQLKMLMKMVMMVVMKVSCIAFVNSNPNKRDFSLLNLRLFNPLVLFIRFLISNKIHDKSVKMAPAHLPPYTTGVFILVWIVPDMCQNGK